MAAVAEQKPRRWTYEEYSRLDDEQRYEIIDGKLLMAPAPDTWHQSWLNALNIALSLHVREKRLGKVMISPVDVILDAENTVQPDLIFVASANLSLIRRRGIFGVPDLLVEVISPTSVERDRYSKRSLYERFQVKEYWLADPANRSLEVFALKEGKYELLCMLEEKGKIDSAVLPSLNLDFADIE